MKDKILAALKTKHASVIKDKGLGDKALLGIAAMLAITVTEEDQIETVVSSDGVVEALTGIQGEVDSRVTDAVKKAKAEKKPEGGGGNEPKPKEDSNESGDDDKAPSWAKGFIDKLDKVTSELDAIKQEKTAKTLSQRITDALKAKKVDDDFIADQLDGRTFNSDEEADAFTAKVEASWGKLKQKFADDLLREGAEHPFSSSSDGESSFISNLKAAVKTAVPQEN